MGGGGGKGGHGAWLPEEKGKGVFLQDLVSVREAVKKLGTVRGTRILPLLYTTEER